MDRAQRIVMDDGINQQGAREGVQICLSEWMGAMHGKAMTARRTFHAGDPQFAGVGHIDLPALWRRLAELTRGY